MKNNQNIPIKSTLTMKRLVPFPHIVGVLYFSSQWRLIAWTLFILSMVFLVFSTFVLTCYVKYCKNSGIQYNCLSAVCSASRSPPRQPSAATASPSSGSPGSQTVWRSSPACRAPTKTACSRRMPTCWSVSAAQSSLTQGRKESTKSWYPWE